MWNDLPYTVFDTGTLDRFKGAVNRCCFPGFVFQFVAQVIVGLRKQFINNFVFTTSACAAGFYNNNKIRNYSLPPYKVRFDILICMKYIIYQINS